MVRWPRQCGPSVAPWSADVNRGRRPRASWRMHVVVRCHPTSTSTSASTTGSSSAPTSTTAVDATCATVARVDRDVRYRTVPDGVDPDLLSLDVYRPPEDCPTRGVLVWVHGGGWSIGDKSNRIDDKATLAVEHGLSLVSVNYRLTTPEAGASVRWPTHPDDVAAAVAWVVAEPDRSGYDGSHLVLVGHSAGAGTCGSAPTTATWRPRPPADRPHCVAPLDTEAYDVTSVIEAGAAADLPHGVRLDPADWLASPLAPVGTVSRRRTGSSRLPDRRALSDRFADAEASIPRRPRSRSTGEPRT